jgi:threonine/homoserine/homoserine lactone efflux protein
MEPFSKNLLGLVLLCLGLLILLPYIPKFFIFLLGAYLVYLGIKLLKPSDY